MKYLLFAWIIPMTIACGHPHKAVENSIDKGSIDLEHLVRQAKDTTKQAPVLILLHGYGGNEKDLFTLADQIPDNWFVVSIRAPFKVANNRYKWFNANLVNEKIVMNFEEEEKSRKQLLKFIDQFIGKYNVDKGKVVTAGFSQGANMALALGLTEPLKIKATGCFSGRFMEEIVPLINNKEALKSKEIFISHGTEDQMLPFKYAEQNQKMLENWGANVSFSKDKIAHTISNKQLDDFIEWLGNLL